MAYSALYTCALYCVLNCNALIYHTQMASCGLLNLATCLPQKFFEFLTDMLNAPIQPLLSMTKDLLSANVQLDLFVSLWAIMVYVLSMFYALLIIWSGFTFILSGYDARKREHAKEWLQNIIVMIVLVQASFFIYQLAVELSAVMTSTTLTLIPSSFFELTLDSTINIGLEIIFSFSYIITLLIASFILIIRYGIVAVGVVLFPLAIFSYFLPPLRPYGLLLLHFLGVCIFVTFLDAIILVGFAKLVEVPLFANIKILVMTSAFLFLNLLMFFLMFFSIVKAAFSLGGKIATLVAKFA